MITLGTQIPPAAAAAPQADAAAEPATAAPGLFAALLAGQVARHAPRAAGAATDDSPALPVDDAESDVVPTGADPLATFAPWPPPAPESPPGDAPTAAPGRASVAAARNAPGTDLPRTDPGAGKPATPTAPPLPAGRTLAAVAVGEPAAADGVAAMDPGGGIAASAPVAAVAPARSTIAATFLRAERAAVATELPASAPPPTTTTALAAPAQGPAPASAATLHIETPVGRSGWESEVATRVAFLVRERITEAQLVLEPAELGPVHARIRIEDGTATVALVAARAETREALEAALPRLRELVESGGVALGDASVSQERQEPAPRQAGAQRGPETDVPAIATGATPAPAREARGLVDLYA